ncbi:sensor histidine kinase, partial [Nonomuraea cypriaca]
MRAPARIAPVVLRLGAIVALVGFQSRLTPAPGLTGTGLIVTLLTAALVIILFAVLVLPLLATAEPPTTADPDKTSPHPSWARRVSGVPCSLVLLGLAVLAAVALNVVTHGGAPAIVALIFCVGMAAARHSLVQSLVIGLLGVAGLVVGSWMTGTLSHDLSLILSVCLTFLLTYSARQRKATRAAEAREAVLAERTRIAREIHDILAHSLSAQLVHLEGAKLLLRAERTDEALDRVVRARDLAKSGLEEARRAVSALRETSPALPAALRMLADEFESATQRSCGLEISGPERRLPPETELALVRTAQEALTNVRRHAPGSPAAVELAFGRAWCELRVTNPTAAVPATAVPATAVP